MKRLKEVLKIQSESGNQWLMFAYIVRRLKSLGIDYYVYNGCIYAQKGEAKTFPCIVSHMDTVHDIVSDLTVLEIEGKLTGFNAKTMKQTGIGGDDKVGIFIALECLESFSNIKAVFFRDEEIGCDGSYDPHHEFFDDCGFVLQCDRKGYGDFIIDASGTKLSGKDFQKAVKPTLQRYGYDFENGMMTDVMALKECGIKCAMANISCGYYNPHSASEYVIIKEVSLVLQMVKELITSLEGQAFYQAYKTKSYSGSYTKSFYKDYYKGKEYDLKKEGEGYFDDWEYAPSKDKTEDYCGACSDLKLLEYVPEYHASLCKECIKDYKSAGYLE